MKTQYWALATLAFTGLPLAACAAHRVTVVTPNYTVNCDQPGQNPNVLAIAQGLNYGNPFHGKAGPGPIQQGRAPFRTVLVADSTLANGTLRTVLGPESELVSEADANRLKRDALASGKIIAKVWVDSAYAAEMDVAGNPVAGSLQLPAGVSYIAACVPKNAANGTVIKGLVIPDGGGAITGITGTFHTTRERVGNSMAVWQSSSKSTMCIACPQGWCHF